MEQDDREQYVSPYDPTNLPVWVWGVLLGFLFLLFVVGIYYASRASGHAPQVSLKQHRATGGTMKTPGAI